MLVVCFGYVAYTPRVHEELPIAPLPTPTERTYLVYVIPSAWTDVNRRMDSCRWSCQITAQAAAADVHVWFPAGGSAPLPPRTQQQLLAVWSREPKPYSPAAFEDPQADLAMTYNLDSNVPINYMPPDYLKQIYSYEIPTAEEFAQRKTAVWLSSNCEHFKYDRPKIVATLQQYISIENRGICLNNAARFSNAAWKAAQEYKFWIGIEKTAEEDYVTEKLFFAYYGNALGVYIGSSRARDFVPDGRSYVDGLLFANTRALGEFLRELSTDYDAWVAYFAWRAKPIPAHMKALENLGEGGEPLCRLCACLANATCKAERRPGKGAGPNVYSNQWISQKYIL